jgi:hypothetical protein
MLDQSVKCGHRDLLLSVYGWPGVDCYSGTEGGVDQKHAVGKR